MKHLYLLTTMLIAVPAAAQDTSDPQQEIVVTGARLSDTKKALEDCLERKCPPEQDISASLAHGENLFVAGDYPEARKVLRQSISRNHRHAVAHPLAVSDLYRAHSRVSIHSGEGDDYRWSTWGIKRALRAGLGDDHIRLLHADLEIAGMQASLNKIEDARKIYIRIARRAAERGRSDLAATAKLREAWLSHVTGDNATTRKKLEPIAGETGSGTVAQRWAAKVLLARLDRMEGKNDSSDALIADLKKVGFQKPTLLYAPPIATVADTLKGQWADVGFWVRPDGRVSDMEVLRQSGHSKWLDPVLKSISGRIYSPLKHELMEGAFRIERYSYTYTWTYDHGSRSRRRSAEPRVELLDLTAE